VGAEVESRASFYYQEQHPAAGRDHHNRLQQGATGYWAEPFTFQMYSFGSSSRPHFIFQPVALLVTLWGMTSGHTIDVMKSRGQQRDVV
jgi:hypothetical protein